MKKTGWIAVIVVALMSCGGANDGKLETDTTHFSGPPIDTNKAGFGQSPKGNDRVIDSMGGTHGPSSPATSSGMNNGGGTGGNKGTTKSGNGAGSVGSAQSDPKKNSSPH